jgi:RNA polymerase sigma-70 factor (ECF subfamily)
MAKSDPSASDEVLMARVRDGSVAAFQALYERHHRALFNFLLRFSADRLTAEDLLQETFLRVYIHRESYRPTAAFRTWLFTIARNLALDHLRRGGIVGESAGEEDRAAALPDPSPSPLRHVEAGEELRLLEAALQQLPPGQREVLLLSRYAGLSHTEIAEVTGRSPEAARVALHRALGRLRDLLRVPPSA